MKFQYQTLACLLVLLSLPPAAAVEYVQLKRDGQTIHISGKLLTDAQDGGLLIQTAEGILWAVPPEELVEHKSDDKPFQPADGDALGRDLLEQLPDGFRIHRTANYVIAYNTSKAYAQWCGSLYERLLKGFYNYWERRGLDLKQPAQPLVAVVFDSKDTFARYARPELGAATASIIGYYSLRTNRVAMYDLTSTGIRGGRRGTMAQINAALARPQASETVATIIHEATHQLAYNCGIHQRYADIPLWLSEGFAVFFETPDLKSSRGWSSIGDVNRPRLVRFRKYLKSRPRDSLVTLLSSDDRFRDSTKALDAYAEAWALNHFLINRHGEAYNEYLRQLAEKGPLIHDEAAERIAAFRRVFKVDLETLDRELVRYALQLR